MNFSDLKDRFTMLYGNSSNEIRSFKASGRVNLIGEHIDYNGGNVLPAALSLNTTVLVRLRDDNLINLAATDLPGVVSADSSKLDDYKSLNWGNYQLGVAYELKKDGYIIPGCDLLYHGTVPFGSGLSSSASIEVATAMALVTLSNEIKGISTPVDKVYLAIVSQRAENRYVGVNCGIMDQFASSLGKKDNAIYLNCKTLDYSYVPLKMDGYKLILTNSNQKRSLADSKYNERRSECELAFDILKKTLPNISCLTDVTSQDFVKYKNLLADTIIQKRAEHVIFENERVKKSVEVLSRSDINSFGNLLVKSHESLKDLYEVTGFELDTLVEEALKIDGVIGSRMTGAGFGGCTVSIVKDSAVEEFVDVVGRNYMMKTGLNADFYVSIIDDGCLEI
jgi:galactokinase